MPRAARTIVPHTAHHVFQRTLDGRTAFYTDKDRQAYLEILAAKCRQHQVDVLAYCLLKDCVHVVAIPRRQDSLARALGRTHFSYAHYLNARRDKNGRLWRSRFQSCALDEEHVPLAVRYVEGQPVGAKLVRKAEKYPWSSAAAHVAGRDDAALLALNVWPGRRGGQRWGRLLAEKLEESMAARIATFTQTGRPLGGAAFVARLEKKYGRRLRALPVGRPRKTT